MLLKIKKDILLPSYLEFYLNQPIVKNALEKLAVGSSRATLTIKDMKKFKITLPPLETQQRIVEVLEKVEQLGEWRKQSEKLTQEYIESAFLKIFGDVFDNQKNWQRKTLEQLTTAIIDCPHSTPVHEKNATEYPCIRTTELRDGYIDWKSMKYVSKDVYINRTKRLIPKEGDIIYGREGNFGEAVRVPRKLCICLGQRVILLRPDYSICNSYFLWALLRSRGVYFQALKSTKGATVGHVDVGAIKKFKVFCPPIEIQQRFAQLVEKIEQAKMFQIKSKKNIEFFSELIVKKLFEENIKC